MRILGIDPGANTGLAYFTLGKLMWVRTCEPVGLDMLIVAVDRVIFEDCRLTSHVYTAKNVSKAAALKVARNIGEIDAWCSLIVAICEKRKIPAIGISPKNKGAKLNAAQFEAATGWSGRSNQHERDAAMVAYPYRKMVK